MKRILIFLLTFAAVACKQTSETTAEAELSPKAFQEALSSNPGIVLLDVRTDAEIKTGYIEGARPLDFNGSHFAESLDSLDHEKSYLVYCAAGKRSAKAMEMMKGKGFKQVSALKGGLNAWRATGLPVTPPQ